MLLIVMISTLKPAIQLTKQVCGKTAKHFTFEVTANFECPAMLLIYILFVLENSNVLQEFK